MIGLIKREERERMMLDDVAMRTNSLALSIREAKDGHCDKRQILERINSRLEGYVVSPKPSTADIGHDPVSQLISDVQSAAEILAKAVAVARAGVKGVSYEDWYLCKVIGDELSKVGLREIPGVIR